MTAVEWLEDLYYPNYIPKEIFEQAKEMEKESQDDFAIGFAEWLNNGRFSQYGGSWIDPRKNKDKNGNWLFFTSKQLLEIYKNETKR